MRGAAMRSMGVAPPSKGKLWARSDRNVITGTTWEGKILREYYWIWRRKGLGTLECTLGEDHSEWWWDVGWVSFFLVTFVEGLASCGLQIRHGGQSTVRKRVNKLTI